MHEAFADLYSQTREMLSDLASEWAEGLLSARAFADAMDAVLLDAHTRAVVIGRTHGGDDAPEDDDDRRFAEIVVEGEHDFLQGFREQMNQGRYTGEDGVRDGEAVARRASLYATRLTGSANEAWTLTLPEDTELTWILAAIDEGNCQRCPELADGSPYTPETLTDFPGGNTVPCRSNCRCRLETETGQRGFVTP